MIEITHILNGNYQYFEDTFFFKTGLSNEQSIKKKEKYLQQVNSLMKISEEIDLSKKLSRLYVLNNSYLSKNKLKDKVAVLITLYSSIAENTIGNPIEKLDIVFNNFPKRWDFDEYIQEIQNEIIQEMKLGYKNNMKYNFDYEKEFKERYKL